MIENAENAIPNFPNVVYSICGLHTGGGKERVAFELSRLEHMCAHYAYVSV